MVKIHQKRGRKDNRKGEAKRIINREKHKKSKMKKIEYLNRLNQLKEELRANGVNFFIPVLLDYDLIEDDYRNKALLEGRTRSMEFLEALEKLLIIVK